MTALWKGCVVLSCILFISQSAAAQITDEVRLRDLPEGTTFMFNQEVVLPTGQTALLLDSGKGKTCSCQFFGKDTGTETVYKPGQQLTLRQVSVKGLFDGSQMHVARVYFNETPNYFKFKCYTRDVEVRHINDFLRVEADAVITKK